MTDERLRQFDGEKYMNLETFRKSGVAVATPVWFAEQDGEFYVYSLANAGKVKRIRNDARVRIVPSDFRGASKGEWVEGNARIIDGAESQRAHELLDKKYGLLKKIGNVYGKLMGRKRAAIAIRLN